MQSKIPELKAVNQELEEKVRVLNVILPGVDGETES